MDYMRQADSRTAAAVYHWLVFEYCLVWLVRSLDTHLSTIRSRISSDSAPG